MGKRMMVAFEHVAQIERRRCDPGDGEANGVRAGVVSRKSGAAAARISKMTERMEEGRIRFGGRLDASPARPHPGVAQRQRHCLITKPRRIDTNRLKIRARHLPVSYHVAKRCFGLSRPGRRAAPLLTLVIICSYSLSG